MVWSSDDTSYKTFEECFDKVFKDSDNSEV